MTKRRIHAEPIKRWTASEEATLRRLYADTKTDAIAKLLGYSLARVYCKATRIGLVKSEAYLASSDACRLRRGDNVGASYRYPKGHVPANKGLRRPGYAPGRMRETQFKKGGFPVNKDPDFYVLGALRVNTDGYIDMRIGFGPGALGWRPLHRILWEDAHGPVPKGHVVTFKDRDKLNVELDNLELLTLADNCRRNSIHNLPAPLKSAITMLGALKRTINRRTRREEQDRGSTQSPIRHAGGAARRRETDGHRTR